MSAFLKNAWYLAAWASEVTDSLMPRRLLDMPVLLFRSLEGRAMAMMDRCPHRFAPLSRGTRVGDTVTCGYHGLVFNADGVCIKNPYGDKIPNGAVVRNFPVMECYGGVWFWPGDPTKIGDARPAPFPFMDTRRTISGRTPMNANYEFATDNLMDLTHIEFVHKGTFAGEGVIFAGKHEALQAGDAIHSNWWMPNVPAPSMSRGIYDPQMKCDHWLEMRWNAPATMYLQIGAAPVGQDRKTGLLVDQAHIITPETSNSSHYFWSSTLPGENPSAELEEVLKAMFAQAFDTEDKPMIEASFANLNGKGFWDERPVFLGVDAGGLRARRLLEDMIRREADISEAKGD